MHKGNKFANNSLEIAREDTRLGQTLLDAGKL